jgi:succinyl-diaminopimelate desuccinylase
MSGTGAQAASQEETVLRQVESLAPEMITFLQDIVRIPTINPPGENYTDCAERIGRQFREFGYETQFIAAEGRPEHSQKYPRVNVMGRMEGTSSRPVLHFNGHFDVVPVGQGWTMDPFGAVVRDGQIFGRGVTDQKAGIAASLFAVEAIRRAGIRLQGTVEQSGTVDEESGGFAGVAYLADKHFIHRDRTDFVIITEPLNVDRVCLGHRGVYWFKVITHGRIGHGSMPFLGVSAVDQMSDVLHHVVHELKPILTQRHTSMPVEPPKARNASINVNAIFGGQPENEPQSPCVVDRCGAIFDRRFLVEEPFEDVKGEVVAILEDLRAANPDFRYSMEDLMIVPPVQTNPAAQVVTTVAGAIEDVIGRKPPLIASPGTYDQKHVMRRGLVDQCIAYGPGILHLSHQPDEYCKVEDLVNGAKVMALATMRLLHVH